jgi:uncharacterized protein
MKSGHGIPARTTAQIAGVLAQFPGVEQAILFGSRAKGTQRRGSDIDLALVGPGLDWQTIGRIDTALDDLPTPYSFSLVIFDERLDESVAAHIRRVGIPLFKKDAAVAQT